MGDGAGGGVSSVMVQVTRKDTPWRTVPSRDTRQSEMHCRSGRAMATATVRETHSGGVQPMAAGQPTRRKTGRRGSRRKANHLPAAEITSPSAPERQFVDIDPWAVLLEQLMEMPEEEPAARKGGKGG